MNVSARHRRRPLLVLLVTALATAALWATTLPAHAATPFATRQAKAEQFASMSLSSFISYAKKAQSKQVATYDLDWSNDGCSADVISSSWRNFFKDPCIRHDFGYRNFGKGLSKGLALRSTNAKKLAVDQKMLSDSRAICASRTRPNGASLATCYSMAQVMYTGVRTSFVGSTKPSWNPQNAFFNHECTTGALCLFDDTGYSDRRITIGPSTGRAHDSTATSVPDLKKFVEPFGDKTSAVWNRSNRAWRLYDDHDFKDRSICVPAGGTISNLKAKPYEFNDKTSSVRRLSTASC